MSAFLEELRAKAQAVAKITHVHVPAWEKWIVLEKLDPATAMAFIRRHRGDDEEGEPTPESEQARAGALIAQYVELIALTATEGGQRVFDSAEGRAFLHSPEVGFAILNTLALAAMELNGFLDSQAEEREKNLPTPTDSSPSNSAAS